MSGKIRVVSYAINGRGMGHLVRQLAILRWVRRIAALLDRSCEIWVLTSSEADTLARREGFVSLKMPSKAMMRDAEIEPARYLAVARTWVLQTVAGLQPDLLVVDTFPGGSFGELVAALELVPHRVLVARKVRDDFAEGDAYRGLLPLYERVILPDDRAGGPIILRERSELLARDEARRALGIPEGTQAIWVSRGGGGDVDAASELPRLVESLRGRGWHVVVGAGPLYQGPEIRGAGITWLSRYAPVELFLGLDAAVSAGGYNSFHELMFAGVPTVFLPQPRIADDQSERVARAEAAGAGKVANVLSEVPDRVAELLECDGASEAARSLVPVNGARAAALEILSTVLSEADLRMATEVLTPDLLALIHRTRDPRGRPNRSLKRMLGLVRLLSGGIPSGVARRRAVLAELEATGVPVPALEDPAPSELGRFVAICEREGVPFDSAEHVIRGLHKKFPAASGADLVEAAQVLFPVFTRFDDWMGVVSLLRALPTQRNYTLDAFVVDVLPWLARHSDLFDAVRDLSRLEGAGDRSVAEVLKLLNAPAQAK